MSNLAEWVPRAEYQAPRIAHFPSLHALDWQIRTHKAALIEAQAIAVIGGRTHLHPERADRVFIEAGQRRVAEPA